MTTRVLFVCLGNICRSPTAEGVFRKIVDDAGLGNEITIDSAGTHAYHSGEPPDRRATAAALQRGYSLAGIKARRVTETDFEEFDYVLAMDKENLSNLRDKADVRFHSRIRLFLEFADESVTEVPDPYYGGAAGFERVLDLVEAASHGMLRDIRKRSQQ